ncbi:MAG: glycosyltransferase family 4 protein [Pseudomonadota bacterium]
MNILHLETGMNLYGGPRQVAWLLEGLHARGIGNTLVCPRGAAISQTGAPHVARVEELRPGLAALRDFNRALAEHRPDIVHVHSRRLGADWWAAWAARHAGIPCIISRRVDNPEPGWLARRKYALYDRVIAISDGIRTVLLNEGVPAGRVLTVRSAVDPAPYLHSCEREAFRATFTLPEDAIVLGVIAQLIPRKGHRHLFAALPDILARHPRVQVLIFGKGALREELESESRRLGLDAHVRFTGFRADLARWLPCLDLVAHPADMEGLGVSLLQAAAAAVPVIATRAGGMPEAVRDGETGLLIEPGDVDGLRAAILRLLDDDALRRGMGQAGQRYVQRECGIDAMVEGNLAVYRDLSGQGEP